MAAMDLLCVIPVDVSLNSFINQRVEIGSELASFRGYQRRSEYLCFAEGGLRFAKNRTATWTSPLFRREKCSHRRVGAVGVRTADHRSESKIRESDARARRLRLTVVGITWCNYRLCAALPKECLPEQQRVSLSALGKA